MKEAQQELSEFELLEKQLLEASHVTDMSGPLFTGNIHPASSMMTSREDVLERSNGHTKLHDEGRYDSTESGDIIDDNEYGTSYTQQDISINGSNTYMFHNDMTEKREMESSYHSLDNCDSDQADEHDVSEEDLSLRHLRKSWTGLNPNTYRRESDRDKESNRQREEGVDDSRSWGDVTAPPADIGTSRIVARVSTIVAHNMYVYRNR